MASTHRYVPPGYRSSGISAHVIVLALLLAVGFEGLALLGYIWAYTDTLFGGHLGLTLQLLCGLCCFWAGRLWEVK